jgi:hypothetical protein
MNNFVERFRVKNPIAANSPLAALEPDDSFTYLAGRAVSYYPQINGNGAFFEEADLAPLINTDKGFAFTLANISHSVGEGKPNQVIGSIRQEASISGSGVDIMAQIDKRACAAYDIDPQDFINNGYLANMSIEIFCDRDKSKFVALTNPASKNLADQKVFTAEEAASQGISRTSWTDEEPYLYDGKYVVIEGCSPIRCRGIAFLPDPADTTANVFEVAANLERASKDKPYGDVKYADNGFRGKARYPVDTAQHTLAADRYFSDAKNRDKYTPEQRDHIDREIAKAKKKFGIGDEEHSGFSLADAPEVVPTSGPSSMPDIMDRYESIDPIDVDAMLGDSMPSSAFADEYFDPEEVADKRAYPLYASAESFVSSRPHPGLVKAALQAHAGGKLNNPSLALQRLQVAHSQLHGAKSMSDEQLATEKAALESKLAEVQASILDKDNSISVKDTELATLKAENQKIAEELAALKAANETRDSEEKANQRLAKLSAIEGFKVADEEKASLLDSLKGEDELAFENRVLKATVASMEEAAKKVKAQKTSDEEAARITEAEEQAALNGLDIFPSHIENKSGKVDLYQVI